MQVLQVIADKLNLRTTPRVDLTFENWAGDINRNDFFTGVEKVTGDSVDGNDEWWVDNLNRFASARWLKIAESDPALTAIRLNYNQLVKNIREDVRASEGRGVKVVVIDSGVTSAHNDIAIKPQNYSGFCTDRNDKFDTIGHGTHVAGIVGAAAPDGAVEGITGLAPKCEVISYKASEDGASTRSFIMSAIREVVKLAAQNPAVIVNCSWNITIPGDFETLLATVPENVIFVCAAGNDEDLLAGKILMYPARLPRMISVGYISTGKASSIIGSGKLNSDLNFVYVGGPLKSCSTPNKNSYADFDRTSMAVALVTGIIALTVSVLKQDIPINTSLIIQELSSQLLPVPKSPPNNIAIFKIN